MPEARHGVSGEPADAGSGRAPRGFAGPSQPSLPAAEAEGLLGLLAAARRLRETAPHAAAESASERGWFRPVEEEALVAWSARHLSVRGALEETIEDALRRFVGDLDRAAALRTFLLGYAAACGLVAVDRFLLEHLAVTAVVQRKLNEGSPTHRIPRKVGYTRIAEAFTAPDRALGMGAAMLRASRLRPRFAGLGRTGPWAELVATLPELETHLDPSGRRYLGRLGAFLGHAWRRRGASALQKTLFGILEPAGRAISEVRDPTWVRRLTPEVRTRLAGLLHPGDVLVTRRERAFTNLFLPGFWPHAALYVGSEADRLTLGVTLDSERCARWAGDRCVLEALKDGVRFRPLAETLDVDALAVIRPLVPPVLVREALERAAVHEGKPYNFDFDFFRSDRLVCTEVVYRAYDGLGALELPLVQRSGRPTLSAEDLLHLALERRGFEPVAVFGCEGCFDAPATGEDATAILAASLRS